MYLASGKSMPSPPSAPPPTGRWRRRHPRSSRLAASSLSRIALLSLASSSLLLRRSHAGPALRHAPLPGISQPDGAALDLYGRGDQEFAYLVDSRGFPVVRDEAGWYIYADLEYESSASGGGKSGTRGGALDSSVMRVGRGFDPAKRGLRRGSSAQLSAWIEREKAAVRQAEEDWDADGSRTVALATALRRERQRRAQRRGEAKETLNNLVVPLAFSDHADRVKGGSVPSPADLDTFMNSDAVDAVLAPTGSIRSVYSEFSYGQLDLRSYIVPRWIIVSQTESFTAGGVSGFTGKSAYALKEALDKVEDGGLLDDLAPDVGVHVEDFDSVTFIHSGRAAEFAGTDCHGADREDRLWAHSRTIRRTSDATGNNHQVIYTLASSFWGTGGKNCRETDIARVGMLSHELGHVLALPDLYGSSTQEGIGVGYYDTMSYVWGADNSQHWPAHLSAWSKIQMGWVKPTLITEDGMYSVAAMASQTAPEPRVYKIKRGYENQEYLLIENRLPIGLDSELRGEGGLIVYHVDSRSPGMTKNGFPGHVDSKGKSKGLEWPTCGRHYFLAILQADGKYDLERGNNIGDKGDLWVKGNQLGPGIDEDNPVAGPHPNTDSYQGGVIRRTGVRLYDIGESGEVMTFRVELDASGNSLPAEVVPTRAPTASPVEKPTESPTRAPKTAPTSSPSRNPTRQSTEVPTQPPTQVPTAAPTERPSQKPTQTPTQAPTAAPTSSPSHNPTLRPTGAPTAIPSEVPSAPPTALPSDIPSVIPSSLPTVLPSLDPTAEPSLGPTISASPSDVPSGLPSSPPTASAAPTESVPPSEAPSGGPSEWPSSVPSSTPSDSTPPSAGPSSVPTSSPTRSTVPSSPPSENPSTKPSGGPSSSPTDSLSPSAAPSAMPTVGPSSFPSSSPSFDPTISVAPSASLQPSGHPSHGPSGVPTESPFASPSGKPSDDPSAPPSAMPSEGPTASPIETPTSTPSRRPTASPTASPSSRPSTRPTSTSAPVFSDFVSTSPGSSQINNSSHETEAAAVQGGTNVPESSNSSESDLQAPTLAGTDPNDAEYDNAVDLRGHDKLLQLFTLSQHADGPHGDNDETSAAAVSESDEAATESPVAMAARTSASQESEFEKLPPNIFLLGT